MNETWQTFESSISSPPSSSTTTETTTTTTTTTTTATTTTTTTTTATATATTKATLLSSERAWLNSFPSLFSSFNNIAKGDQKVRRVLLINDSRFVNHSIATYLITTLRIGGFIVDVCSNIPIQPNVWHIHESSSSSSSSSSSLSLKDDCKDKISNINPNFTINNPIESKESTDINTNINSNTNDNEKKNENEDDEKLFPSPSSSTFLLKTESKNPVYDAILIPPQTNSSLWEALSMESKNNLYNFIHNDGKSVVLLHFRGCEIVNGLLNMQSQSQMQTQNQISVSTQDLSHISNITLTHTNDTIISWHETSVRLGPSQINSRTPRKHIPKNIYRPDIIGDIQKQLHTLQAPELTINAPKMLPAVNSVMGMLGVPNDCVCYRTNDDFSTVAVKQLGNGSVAILGHDFSEIVVKDWNRVLFLVLKQQLLLKNGEDLNVLPFHNINIEAIKKLNISTTSNNNKVEDFEVDFDNPTTSTIYIDENSHPNHNDINNNNTIVTDTNHSDTIKEDAIINFDEFDISLENFTSNEKIPDGAEQLSDHEKTP